MEKNYYQVLGLEEGVSLEEIKVAYRKYAVKFHPDKQNGDEFFKERFQDIQEAYEYLCQNYDKERYEDSNSPTDCDVYEQEDEDIVEDEHPCINDKYYIKLLRKEELLEWFRLLNVILFSLIWIGMCIYLYSDAMQEKYNVVEWLDMSGTWLEPTIAFIAWLGFTLLGGFTFSYILPVLAIWVTPIDKIESKITEYKNRLDINPYLDNNIWKEILRTDFHYQELCRSLNKVKKKVALFWSIWIGVLVIILCFTWIPFIEWADKGWWVIFAMFGYPIILGCSIIGILYLFKLRPTDYQYYILIQKIQDYKNEIINTYRKENY